MSDRKQVTVTVNTLDGESASTPIGEVEGIKLEREYGLTLKEALESERLEYIGYLAYAGLRRRKELGADTDEFTDWLDSVDGFHVEVDADPTGPAPTPASG